MRVWLPRPGVHPGRAAAQGLGDQRLTDSPVGPGHQDGLAVDRYAHRYFLLELKRLLAWIRPMGLALGDWAARDPCGSGRAGWWTGRSPRNSSRRRSTRTRGPARRG